MKTLLSWSSGKDSAWCLHVLRQDPAIELCGLVTTINESADRVAMHGVRRALLAAQAATAGLPLFVIPLPDPCPNEIYEQRMSTFLAQALGNGIEAMAFGDLFLEDIRTYREQQLAGTNIRPLFPLWQRPTAPLAREMIDGGLEAWITCVDTRQIDAGLAGRRFDMAFLDNLPASADPCGEHGEFHSFVTAGPMFAHPIAFEPGVTVERDGFVFADLLPAD